MARRELPDVPHVAVFDTSFHRTIPPEAALYAVPLQWGEEWGVRRYGFHGLSVEWCVERVSRLVGAPVERLVVCHLGGGSSVTAVRGGHSVDTTMGFSPLEGVPMTTRSGSVDPGALLYLLRDRGFDPRLARPRTQLRRGHQGPRRRNRDGRGRAARSRPRCLGAACNRRDAAPPRRRRCGDGDCSRRRRRARLHRRHRGRLVARTGRRLHTAAVSWRRDRHARNEAAEPDCDIATADSSVRILVVRARRSSSRLGPRELC